MNSDYSKDKGESLRSDKTDSEYSNDSFFSFCDDDSSEEDAASFSDMLDSTRGGTNFGSGGNFHSVKNNPGSSDNRRRSSLVTPTFRYDRTKPENLFPPTKKYRYYPLTCYYCGIRFQPNKLKAHQKKHHLSGTDEVKPTRRVRSASVRRGIEKQPSTSRSQSVGGVPRHLQTCYICGRLFGSVSLQIHEPKCLEKWRIQNQQLPPELKAPEPVKPELMPKVGTGKDDYDVPELDPKAEAAYRSHLATLILCKHCSRTFSPDRIIKHMSCCIERPTTRECITPTGGEIPR